MRLSDDRVIAPTTGAIRTVARAVMARGRAVTLLAFAIADTHLHVLVACSRADARRFAHHAAIAIGRLLRLRVPFEPTRVRPVVDQRHLYQAFRYVLRQHEHHGLGSDPAHDGSSLPDLLGMRILDPGHAQTVRMILPRLDRRQLAASLGIVLTSVGATPAELLVSAAAAAAGLPDLASRAPACVQARRAAVRAAGELPTRTIALALGASSRSIQRLRGEEVDPRLVRAVELQWRFRASLAERGLLLG
jgi:hypothetical protein